MCKHIHTYIEGFYIFFLFLFYGVDYVHSVLVEDWKGLRAFGTGIPESYKLRRLVLGQNEGPLQEQQVPQTVKPPLQPCAEVSVVDCCEKNTQNTLI